MDNSVSDHRIRRFDDRLREGEHIWTTLGFRRLGWSEGSTTIEWDATAAYGFPTAGGALVHGGMITTILDTAMGGACWSVLDEHEAFLTADLRVEFLRATRVGTVRATGSVVRRTRRIVFCEAQLHDDAGVLLAASRCTQVVLPADGSAGRYTGEGRATSDQPAVEDGRG